jgi:hypothetical protein
VRGDRKPDDSDDREEPPLATVALWLARIPHMRADALASFVERNGRFWRLGPEIEAAVAHRRRELSLEPGVEDRVIE